MSLEFTPDPIRQQALAALTAHFISEGHPSEYAPTLATSAIFQADLDLRNAQLSRLLAWLKQEHAEIYQPALDIVQDLTQEFEQRVQTN